MTLLDVGCGWGSTMLRATSNRHQYWYVRDQLADRLIRGRPYGGVRREGWEEFDRRPDCIVCIGRLEHLQPQRYPDFFDFAYRILPGDGVLLMQTVVAPGRDRPDAHRIRSAGTDFVFSPGTIFPIDRLPPPTGRKPTGVAEYAEDAGFTITGIERPGPHYTTTLQCWATAWIEIGPDDDNAVAGGRWLMIRRNQRKFPNRQDTFRTRPASSQKLAVLAPLDPAGHARSRLPFRPGHRSPRRSVFSLGSMTTSPVKQPAPATASAVC